MQKGYGLNIISELFSTEKDVSDIIVEEMKGNNYKKYMEKAKAEMDKASEYKAKAKGMEGSEKDKYMEMGKKCEAKAAEYKSKAEAEKNKTYKESINSYTEQIDSTASDEAIEDYDEDFFNEAEAGDEDMGGEETPDSDAGDEEESDDDSVDVEDLDFEELSNADKLKIVKKIVDSIKNNDDLDDEEKKELRKKIAMYAGAKVKEPTSPKAPKDEPADTEE